MMRGLKVDKTIPWYFFGGVCSASIYGCVLVVFISNSHFFDIKYIVQMGSNNYGELLALFLILKFNSSRDTESLHIFGYYDLVINWMNGKNQLHKINLLPLGYFKHVFSNSVLSHLSRIEFLC